MKAEKILKIHFELKALIRTNETGQMRQFGTLGQKVPNYTTLEPKILAGIVGVLDVIFSPKRADLSQDQ